MKRAVWIVALIAICAPVTQSSAAGVPALVAVDNAAPTLSQQRGGGWAGTLSLTNLTENAITLAVKPTSTPPKTQCKTDLAKAAIGASQSRGVKLTISKECGSNGSTLDLTLTATGSRTQSLAIAADLKQSGEPDWSQLLAFLIALGVVGLVLVLWCWRRANVDMARVLQYLESSYSFKESWVANVTVIGGLLTGLFGSSEVVKAFLGEDVDQAVALATVGAAIAVIFIAVGPLILTAAKKDMVNDDPAFTVYGLILATTVIVAGASGELWVASQSGDALDPGIGGWTYWVWGSFAVSVVLLGWYTLATFNATLKAGTTPPPPPKKTDLARLIELLEDALRRSDDVPNDSIGAVLKEVVKATPDVELDVDDSALRLQRALEQSGDVPGKAVQPVIEEFRHAAAAPGVTVAGAQPIITQRRTAGIL